MPALRAAENGAPTLFRAGDARRLRLWNGERITGQVLDLDRNTLHLRTVWAARLDVPRAAVAAIEPLPGWRTIFYGEPGIAAAGLRLTGDPALVDAEDGTAGRAFLLRAAGQSLTHVLKKPLSAGRIGVNFQERESAREGRWTVELLLHQGERNRRVTVGVAGAGDSYAIDAGGLKGTAQQVAKTSGWHRLIVQFSKHSLRLTCDDEVLWYNLDEGPGGDLRQVTIACQQTKRNEKVQGAVAWTEFSIERAVDEHPPPPADAEQDALRLLDDDQLFGRILQADRRSILIEGRFGKRALPWPAVSGCTFRRPPGSPKASEGAKVRLLVRSGLCAEPDVLEGVVTVQDERRVILKHTLIGELTIERSRVRERQLLPMK